MDQSSRFLQRFDDYFHLARSHELLQAVCLNSRDTAQHHPRGLRMAGVSPPRHLDEGFESLRTQPAEQLSVALLAQHIEQETGFVAVRPIARVQHLDKTRCWDSPGRLRAGL